jgi:hypothetical protein
MFNSLHKLQELHWNICHFECEHEMSAAMGSKLAVGESVSVFIHANHIVQSMIVTMVPTCAQNDTI